MGCLLEAEGEAGPPAGGALKIETRLRDCRAEQVVLLGEKVKHR